jgi:hypothetical protein
VAALRKTGGKVDREREKLPILDMPYFKDNCPVTFRMTSIKIRIRTAYLTIAPSLEKIEYLIRF